VAAAPASAATVVQSAAQHPTAAQAAAPAAPLMEEAMEPSHAHKIARNHSVALRHHCSHNGCLLSRRFSWLSWWPRDRGRRSLLSSLRAVPSSFLDFSSSS
jgi:hypothetical protein